MLYIDYTQKLLNLQGVLVKKVTSAQHFTLIDIEMPVVAHICPDCATSTSYIHDYRQQLIKDIPAFGVPVILNYRRRRYRCPHCGKCFSEKHPFVPKYHRMTRRLVAHIIDRLGGRMFLYLRRKNREFVGFHRHTNLRHIELFSAKKAPSRLCN